MKIFYTPKVYLVAHTNIINAAVTEFLTDHNIDWSSDAFHPADFLPELGGRLCYMSFDKPRPGGNAAYLGNIKKQGHGSVLEHPAFSFVFTQISRTCSHELVRHRAGMAYSQLSQRYVDESVCEVIAPLDLQPEIRAAHTLVETIAATQLIDPKDALDLFDADQKFRTRCVTTGTDGDGTTPLCAGMRWIVDKWNAFQAYRKQVEYLYKKLNPDVKDEKEILSPTPETVERRKGVRKRARQAARADLPNCCETKIMVSCNGRSLRHFLEMRASPAAEPEIRALAMEVYNIAKPVAPELLADYQVCALPDGTQCLETQYRKV